MILILGHLFFSMNAPLTRPLPWNLWIPVFCVTDIIQKRNWDWRSRNHQWNPRDLSLFRERIETRRGLMLLHLKLWRIKKKQRGDGIRSSPGIEREARKKSTFQKKEEKNLKWKTIVDSEEREVGSTEKSRNNGRGDGLDHMTVDGNLLMWKSWPA